MNDIKTLIKIAKDAMQYAYVPYSNFKVGAAIETNEGKIFSGCNVENSSYGCTICAERTAVLKAISEGYNKFVRIVVISDSNNFTYPCGICRQVLSEFNSDIEVIVCDKNENYKIFILSDLLPSAFRCEDMITK